MSAETLETERTEMRARFEVLCEEIDELLLEAQAPEPLIIKPTKKHVAAVLGKMSQLAHHQTQTAVRIGTRSAMKLAAHTHLRVAHAASMHGFKKLAGVHSKVSQDLHQVKLGKPKVKMTPKPLGSGDDKKAQAQKVPRGTKAKGPTPMKKATPSTDTSAGPAPSPTQ